MSVFQELNRRHFLQGTAAGAAAALASTQGWAAEGKSPNDRPVFGSIGLRNQGMWITKSAKEAADVVALADVDANVLGTSAKKLFGGKKSKRVDTYGDYRKILDRQDIDAVMIATPDHWHTKISVEAMYAGKDVYCEKPLTLTIDEGKLIEKVVKETGRVFQVGTQQRSTGLFLQAVAMVRDGRVGRVKKVTCGIDGFGPSPVIPVAPVPEALDWDQWVGPAQFVEYRALPELREGYGGGVPLYSNCHYSFRHWHDFAGGKLTDWGAHHVDIACWALGATDTGPSKITPLDFELSVEHKDGYPVVDDRYNAAMRFNIQVDMPDDVEMIITSKPPNGIMFEGTKGRFFVNRGKIVGKPVEDLADNPLPEGAIEDVYGGPVRNHVVNFIDSMASRKQPISDVWSHNRMLEICHLSNIAMRLDRSLEWDPVKREIVGDGQANSFLAREYRKGFEIEA